jgi:endonuclease/exonuclease/phosphatase family metal-dependent hydrolase
VQRLRILSANLLNGGADPQAFRELVSRLAVDVAAVQELSPEQADSLAEVLPHGRLDGASDFTGMGIALRHPAHVERLSQGFRHFYAAQLDPREWPGLRAGLEVIGTHIWAPHEQPFWRTPPRRRLQIRTLESYLDSTPREARVLVGDFNSTPLWPVYRRLARRFRDAAAEVAGKVQKRPERTWAPWPGGPRLLRIDHAFVKGVTPEDFRVEHVPGSDHWAIVLDVSV